MLIRGFGLLLAILINPATAAGVDEDLHQPVPRSRTEIPAAEELLEAVRSAMPRQDMQIQARIKAHEHNGRPSRTIYAEVLLHTGAGLYSAIYTIADAFGTPLEQLMISREPDRAPHYRYRKGDPLEDTTLPDLYGHICQTDLTWIDLSLSFLWWPDGETIATEKVRGRSCYVMELPAPDDGSSELAAVRLWVDSEIPMLLKAEAFNPMGERVRKLTVESFKKVNGVWFIKDINVYSYPAGAKTTMRVNDLKVLDDVEFEGITSSTIE
jgi:hypothetical protein